jgi:hypothetical protein
MYSSPRVFVDGFSPALWVGVGLSALGMFAATFFPGRRARQNTVVVEPGFAYATD